MKNGLTILRRELAAYFNSPIAYIFIVVFSLVNSFLYMSQFFLIGQADMRSFFGMLPVILCVFLPAVTMRLWSEDSRGNTLELLLTFPMQAHELVLGKYLAAFVFYLIALGSTLVIPVMLMAIGRPDMGASFGGYAGAVLAGAFFLALGTFISGLSKDQIVSFILTVLACFTFYLIGLEFIASSIDGWFPGFGSFLQQFFSMTGRYAGFERGIIDVTDILYFLIGVSVFLVLNGFWIEGRSRPKAKAIFSAAVGVCVVIFVTANWLMEGISFGRFDLTEGKIYTISEASRQILRDLKTPVTCKLYISHQEKMPTGMKTVESDIIDKLDELRIAAGGKLSYKIFHMEAARVTEMGKEEEEKSSLEETLQGKGIQPFEVRSIEADEVGVALVYSAISIAYKEKPEEVIPRVFPQNLSELEYLLLSKIYRLTLEEEPRIALLAPYSERGVDPQLQALMSQLGQSVPNTYTEDDYKFIPEALRYEGYEIDRIRLTKEEPIPDGTDTLLVVAPEDLNERQLYEIGWFVRGGGSLFIAAQGYTYSYEPSGRAGIRIVPEKNNHNLSTLLGTWGLGVSENFLMDEENEVLSISGAAAFGPFALSVPVRTPIHILVKAGSMNPNVSITSRLSSLFYLWGSALTVKEDKLADHNLALTRLFSSSARSWEVPYHDGPLTSTDIEGNRFSSSGNFPLAVMVEGTFPDPFEGKAMPAWPPKAGAADDISLEKTETEDRPLTPAPGKLILTGCSTFLQENFFQGGGHMAFLLNVVDALTLGDQLIQIRSKQPIDRTIPRLSAGVKATWKAVATFVPLVIFSVFGFLRLLWRRRSKQNYVKSLELTV